MPLYNSAIESLLMWISMGSGGITFPSSSNSTMAGSENKSRKIVLQHQHVQIL
jgi:hypothetical protein